LLWKNRTLVYVCYMLRASFNALSPRRANQDQGNCCVVMSHGASCHSMQVLVFVNPLVFLKEQKQNITVTNMAILTSRTVGLFSDSRQLRCQPALSGHSIVFARWRQQHTGDLRWGVSRRFS